MKQRAGIDIGFFLKTIKKNLLFILVSMSLAATLAVLLIYYLPSKYEITASVKVNDETSSSVVENLFEGVQVVEKQKSTANEIVILKSFELIRRALNNLNYRIIYYQKKGVTSNEVFSNLPFEIVIDTLSDQLVNTPVNIKFIDSRSYTLSVEDDKVEIVNYNQGSIVKTSLPKISIHDTLNVGEYVEYPALRFTLQKKGEFKIEDNFFFVLQNIDLLAEQYQEKLKIAPLSKDGSIIELKMVSSVPEKEIHFINEVIALYIQQGLGSENRIVDRIIGFIDNQLIDISDSLQHAEMALKQFRSKNGVLDLDYASKNGYDEMKALEKQKSEELIKFKYYEYLSEYVSKNDDINEILAPSVIGMQDPTLNGLITALSEYTAEKTALNYSANERNPKYSIVQKNIENTRRAIIEDVNNIKVASQIKLTDIQGRLVKINKEINALPESERVLINAQRKFDFNDNIYSYFLQKRSEAAILKESNVTSNIVIDQARVLSDPVSPNKKLIFVLMLGAGAVLPLLVVFTKNILSDKILSKDDIYTASLNSNSIMEEIPFSSKGKPQHAHCKIDKRCFESFRSMKLKIEKDAAIKIICFTSLVKGDGKSFCVANTAKAFSLSGKRVLIIDLNVNNAILSSELPSANDTRSQLINSDGHEFKIFNTSFTNLYVLSLAGGTSIENFAGSERFKQLFATLSSLYDFILIDCPDVTGSADFLTLNDLTQLNLFVVRRNHTPVNISKLESIMSKSISTYYFVFNNAE